MKRCGRRQQRSSQMLLAGFHMFSFMEFNVYSSPSVYSVMIPGAIATTSLGAALTQRSASLHRKPKRQPRIHPRLWQRNTGVFHIGRASAPQTLQRPSPRNDHGPWPPRSEPGYRGGRRPWHLGYEGRYWFKRFLHALTITFANPCSAGTQRV